MERGQSEDMTVEVWGEGETKKGVDEGREINVCCMAGGGCFGAKMCGE